MIHRLRPRSGSGEGGLWYRPSPFEAWENGCADSVLHERGSDVESRPDTSFDREAAAWHRHEQGRISEENIEESAGMFLFEAACGIDRR